MVSTRCQEFHGEEILWDRVVVNGADPLSVLLII